MKIAMSCLLTVFLTTVTFAQHDGHKMMKSSPSVTMDKSQTKCPILGEPIDKKVFTDYKGKRIYFCCSGCIADFKKDPEKYMKKMKEEGVLLQ